MIVARNRAAGTTLAEQYGFQWQPDLGTDLPGLLVNVTPIGMAGAAEAHDLAFPETAVAGAAFVIRCRRTARRNSTDPPGYFAG